MYAEQYNFLKYLLETKGGTERRITLPTKNAFGQGFVNLEAYLTPDNSIELRTIYTEYSGAPIIYNRYSKLDHGVRLFQNGEAELTGHNMQPHLNASKAIEQRLRIAFANLKIYGPDINHQSPRSGDYSKPSIAQEAAFRVAMNALSIQPEPVEVIVYKGRGGDLAVKFLDSDQTPSNTARDQFMSEFGADIYKMARVYDYQPGLLFIDAQTNAHDNSFVVPFYTDDAASKFYQLLDLPPGQVTKTANAISFNGYLEQQGSNIRVKYTPSPANQVRQVRPSENESTSPEPAMVQAAMPAGFPSSGVSGGLTPQQIEAIRKAAAALPPKNSSPSVATPESQSATTGLPYPSVSTGLTPQQIAAIRNIVATMSLQNSSLPAATPTKESPSAQPGNAQGPMTPTTGVRLPTVISYDVPSHGATAISYDVPPARTGNALELSLPKPSPLGPGHDSPPQVVMPLKTLNSRSL